MENPFIISGYLSPDYFCDREEETNRIISALQNRRNITVTSIRRLGKTGLIKNVFYHLKNSNLRLLYVDIMSSGSLTEFIEILSNAILLDEKTHSKDYLKKLSRLLTNIKARLVFDHVTGIPAVEIGYAHHSEAEMSLEQIFGYLGKQKASYVIAIDEFQQIVHYKEKNMEAILRTYIQQLNNVSFIFSGSNRRLLVSMFSDYGRPFYQSTDFMFLNRIPKEIYAKFIHDQFAKHKRQIEREDIVNILDYYDVYTFYVQSFYNRLFATGVKIINQELIEKVKAILLEEREYIFLNYKNLLTTNQFDLLKAVAKEEVVSQPTSKAFMKKHGFVQASSLRKILQTLVDKDVVYQEDQHYKVSDLFFAKWLKMKY
ncbi:MAG: ATP-binding protein [Prevotellaceae bacterium]|jgi:hypothetical protein|nr:ATP-binding protein [Prevotellaceae bacterium]